MAFYIPAPVTPCFTQNVEWRDFCIPDIQPCNPNPSDGLIRECGQTWNAGGCQHKCWSFPYFGGDKIQLQTRLRDTWNTNPEAPDDGWNLAFTARLVDRNTGELLSEDVTEFCSRYLVGHDGQGSYQILEVDTSLEIFEDVACWAIEYGTNKPLGEDEIEVSLTDCTEDFCEVEPCIDCDQWVKLKPKFKHYDGQGYWYGNPVAFAGPASFKFEPEYLIPAYLTQTGGEIIEGEFNPGNAAVETSKVWILEIGELVPPYVFNLFVKSILPASGIEINQEIFTYRPGTLTRDNRRSRLFIFSLNLYQDERQTKSSC